jgi:hypothetical protein
MSITGKESEEQSDNITLISKVDKLETSKTYCENHFYNPVLD